MYQYSIGPNDGGQRLDRLLKKLLPDCPTALFYKWNRQKKIKLNRKRVELSSFVQEGDQLDLYLPEGVTPRESRGAGLTLPPALEPCRVVYEDPQVLVLEKPVGVPTQPDDSGSPSLREMALAHLIQNGSYLPQREHSFAPAPCNRLDRNTQGLVLFGKTAAALRELTRLIREGRAEKRYLCLAAGALSPDRGELRGHIVKDGRKNRSRVYPAPQPGSKPVHSRYRVIAPLGEDSLVEITLLTGRSHQIRAQLAAAGHPLLGDGKYGGPTDRYTRQALCAYLLRLHPEGDSPLAYLEGKTFSLRPWFLPGDFSLPHEGAQTAPTAYRKEEH